MFFLIYITIWNIFEKWLRYIGDLLTSNRHTLDNVLSYLRILEMELHEMTFAQRSLELAKLKIINHDNIFRANFTNFFFSSGPKRELYCAGEDLQNLH